MSESDSESSTGKGRGGIRQSSPVPSETTDEDSQGSRVSSGSFSRSASSSEISTSSSDASSASTASDVEDDKSSDEEFNALDLFEEEPQEVGVHAGKRNSISMRISNKRRMLLEKKLNDELGEEMDHTKSGESDEDRDKYSDSSESESDISSDESDSDEGSVSEEYDSDDEDAKYAATERRNPIERGGVPIETLVEFGAILWKVVKHSQVKGEKEKMRHHHHKPKHYTTKEVLR